jgi:hypothetical protein
MVRAVLIFAVTIIAASLFAGCDASNGNEKQRPMKAQLTIYVAPPLLVTGGTVIVVSNPVSPDEWLNLAEGSNPAKDDPNNGKKKDMFPGDKLFGAIVSTKANIVEFVYPEGGDYGFNLVAAEGPYDPDKRMPSLQTKQILVGDGGYTDWSTGKNVIWKNVATIHIIGPESSEDSSRGLTFSTSNIMNLHPQKTVYEGAVRYTPTDEELAKSLIEAPR